MRRLQTRTSILFCGALGLVACEQSSGTDGAAGQGAQVAKVEPASIAKTKVLVNSDPSGASVFENGVLIGKTPLNHAFDRSPGLASRLLSVELEGYEKTTVRASMAEDAVFLSVALNSVAKDEPEAEAMPTLIGAATQKAEPTELVVNEKEEEEKKARSTTARKSRVTKSKSAKAEEVVAPEKAPEPPVTPPPVKKAESFSVRQVD